jgi:toxin secretion/phage lysis holin
VGAWLGYFVGGMDGLLSVLITMIIIDYVTGVMVAISQKKLSSEIGFKGICKKILIMVFVGIANIIDINIIATGSMLRTATIFFYISNEGISVIENTALLGLPVPKKITNILEQLHDTAEKEDETGDEGEK